MLSPSLSLSLSLSSLYDHLHAGVRKLTCMSRSSIPEEPDDRIRSIILERAKGTSPLPEVYSLPDDMLEVPCSVCKTVAWSRQLEDTICQVFFPHCIKDVRFEVALCSFCLRSPSSSRYSSDVCVVDGGEYGILRFTKVST